MRLAHISDLHFACWDRTSWDWSPAQLLSKRWLGNLNFLFGRKKDFHHSRLKQLPALFRQVGISHVLITGDVSTTSAPAELKKAQEFVQALETVGLEVLVIPGNHDHYTKQAYKERHFYRYFHDCWDKGNLKEKGVTAKALSPSWWIVGLDTALATSWFHSTGYFHPTIESALEEMLQHIPSSASVLLMNHFPFFQHESPRKRLVRGEALQKLIEQYPQIKIYCHGHTHRQRQTPGLPFILDSGSTPHQKNGGWNLIDLQEKTASIQFYKWEQKWIPHEALHALV